jgi:hypothetical protein
MSANREAAEALVVLLEHLDPLDERVPRPAARERDEVIDALDGPFEDGLHGAVAGVAGPARDALLEREAANRVSEEHSLDPPMDDDTASHPVTPTRLVGSSRP